MEPKSKRLLLLARHMRHSPTPWENRLWQVLRNRNLCGLKFRRQVPFGYYIVDFCCPEVKLVIEVDGGGHLDQQDYDLQRTIWITEQGFQVLRFTNEEIDHNINAVIETIKETAGL